MCNVTTDAICKTIDETIREQWALGADRNTMTTMVQTAVRQLLAETVIAKVTTAPDGKLTDQSTVTVGEFTWPIPERTEKAGVIGLARIQAALREHGYTMLPDRVGAPTEPGVYEMPVRPVETNET